MVGDGGMPTGVMPARAGVEAVGERGAAADHGAAGEAGNRAEGERGAGIAAEVEEGVAGGAAVGGVGAEGKRMRAGGTGE